MSRILRGGLIAFLFLGFVASASASDLTGMAGVGIRLGGCWFTSGLDPDRTSTDKYGNPVDIPQSVSPRLSGDLVASYVWSDNITIEAATGWSWSAITAGDDALQDSFYVATSVPFIIGARYNMRHGKTWRPFIGAGGGGYWVSVLTRDLGPAKDPVTYEDLRKFVPGVYGTVGVERPVTKLVTATGDAAYHYAFWEDKEKFPSGFNGDKAYFQLRLAMIFHFSVSERIETGFPE